MLVVMKSICLSNRLWLARQSKYSDLIGKYIKQGMFNERPYYRKTCTLKGTSITRTYYLIYYQKGTAIEKGKPILYWFGKIMIWFL